MSSSDRDRDSQLTSEACQQGGACSSQPRPRRKRGLRGLAAYEHFRLDSNEQDRDIFAEMMEGMREAVAHAQGACSFPEENVHRVSVDRTPRRQVTWSTGSRSDGRDLDTFPPDGMPSKIHRPDDDRGIPRNQREHWARAVEDRVRQIPTHHRLYLQDCCAGLPRLETDSIDLVVTSPPRWAPSGDGDGHDHDHQLSEIETYEHFQTILREVWEQCQRVLKPGGRLCVITTDRPQPERDHDDVVPFPADIRRQCHDLGFDCLAPIFWHTGDEDSPSERLARPYRPIESNMNYILPMRVSQKTRSPTEAQRQLSLLSPDHHETWFQQVWSDALDIQNVAERLVRMFSFVGDTVMDPFMGTATTSIAAARWGRDSIGFEIESACFEQAMSRLQVDMASDMNITLHQEGDDSESDASS